MEASPSTTNAAAAVPSPPASAKGSSGKLLLRTITILIGAPVTFLIVFYSKATASMLVFVVFCISSMEWSGLKRHLKVAILHRPPHGTSSNNNNGGGGLSSSRRRQCGAAVGDSAVSTPVLYEVPEDDGDYGGEDEDEEFTDVFSPLLNRDVKEFDLPVPTLTSYQVLKHLGWAHMTIAAAVGEGAVMILFIVYFLIFVGVTIMAHRRLELKVQEAVQALTDLSVLRGSRSASRETTPQRMQPSLSFPAGEADADGAAGGSSKTKELLLFHEDIVSSNNNNTSSPSISISEYATEEEKRFAKLELSVIVNSQPAEQFVDFCLDIFGFVWLSGIALPLLVYSVPSIGFSWVVATILGSFVNDIAALVTGRTVKALVTRWHRSHSSHSRSSSASAKAHRANSSNSNVHNALAADDAADNKKKQSRSLWDRVTGVALAAPHPLYVAISPNKSIEGAAAGVLFNALTFSWCLSLLLQCPSFTPPLPPGEKPLRFNCFPVWLGVGVLMGIAGVVGDLLQSLLKRVSRVKDAGRVLPGHGGMLDRVDGLLLIFPLMYCALKIIIRLG